MSIFVSAQLSCLPGWMAGSPYAGLSVRLSVCLSFMLLSLPLWLADLPSSMVGSRPTATCFAELT